METWHEACIIRVCPDIKRSERGLYVGAGPLFSQTEIAHGKCKLIKSTANPISWSMTYKVLKSKYSEQLSQ